MKTIQKSEGNNSNKHTIIKNYSYLKRNLLLKYYSTRNKFNQKIQDLYSIKS